MTLINPNELVNKEVNIYTKDSTGIWYKENITKFPIKENEVINSKARPWDYDCYYMMIGTSTESWCFIPTMLGRDFYLNNELCTVMVTLRDNEEIFIIVKV